MEELEKVQGRAESDQWHREASIHTETKEAWVSLDMGGSS